MAVAEMDRIDLQQLSEEQTSALIATDEQICTWTKFKDDYDALKSRLATLPDKVSYDIMVPFTSLAFMPGRLIHTNELLVLLGDNWFVERSARDAVQIVDRRLKVVTETLSGLEKQRTLLASRHDFTKDLHAAAAGGAELEIREEYDEQKEKAWREEHRRRASAEKKARASSARSSTAAATAAAAAAATGAATDHVRIKSEAHTEAGRCFDDATAFARLAELDRQERERRELLGGGVVASPDQCSVHHAGSGDSKPDSSVKKRVTFSSDDTRQSSSGGLSPSTANVPSGYAVDSDDEEDDWEPHDEDEEEEEEDEVDDEGEEEEEEGEDEEEAGEAVKSPQKEFCLRRPEDSGISSTIYFTHTQLPGALVNETRRDESLALASALASVHTPADVDRLLVTECSPPVSAVSRLPSLPDVTTTGRLESPSPGIGLKSILKQRRGGQCEVASGAEGEPSIDVRLSAGAVHSRQPVPASSHVQAFRDHVVEKEPGVGDVSMSESAQQERVERPVSKFRAQQKLHRP